MLLIGTDQDNVVRFRNQRWWAEKGLICLEEADGSYETMTVRTCLQRLGALSEMIGNSMKKQPGVYLDEIKEHHLFFEQMVAVCKRAQDQGRPDVDAHKKQIMEERKSKLVVVPGFDSQF